MFYMSVVQRQGVVPVKLQNNNELNDYWRVTQMLMSVVNITGVLITNEILSLTWKLVLEIERSLNNIKSTNSAKLLFSFFMKFVKWEIYGKMRYLHFFLISKFQYFTRGLSFEAAIRVWLLWCVSSFRVLCTGTLSSKSCFLKIVTCVLCTAFQHRTGQILNRNVKETQVLMVVVCEKYVV